MHLRFYQLDPRDPQPTTTPILACVYNSLCCKSDAPSKETSTSDCWHESQPHASTNCSQKRKLLWRGRANKPWTTRATGWSIEATDATGTYRRPNLIRGLDKIGTDLRSVQLGARLRSRVHPDATATGRAWLLRHRQVRHPFDFRFSLIVINCYPSHKLNQITV